MNQSSKTKHFVLIIDRQNSSWLIQAKKALEEGGYVVEVLQNYDYNSATAGFGDRGPDLVVLGCARIKRDEHELINQILAAGDHLVVFCPSLPWGDMRSLFLAGADDVVDDKPYDSTRLVNIVQQAFVGIDSKLTSLGG